MAATRPGPGRWAFTQRQFALGAAVACLVFPALSAATCGIAALARGGEVVVLFSEVEWWSWAGQMFVITAVLALIAVMVFGYFARRLATRVEHVRSTWAQLGIWFLVGTVAALPVALPLTVTGLTGGTGLLIPTLVFYAGLSTATGWFVSSRPARRPARVGRG